MTDAADADRTDAQPAVGGRPGVVRGSGDAAVAAAEQRAEHTGGRNVTPFSELPIDRDTANLREGPDLHPVLLALLPLVGVWEGEGEADTADRGEHRFGQQLVVTHDGQDYLSWSSRSWTFDSGGAVDAPAYRESGFWRINAADEIEFVVCHAAGAVEVYYGTALGQAAWELATDVVLSTRTGVELGGAKRLYGLVEGGDLGWVEERVRPEGGLAPRMSARLARVAG